MPGVHYRIQLTGFGTAVDEDLKPTLPRLQLMRVMLAGN